MGQDIISVLHLDGTKTDTIVQVPDVPKVLTVLAFKRRFTAQERIAIRASANAVVQDFMDLLDSAQDVKLADADVVAGVQYLEAEGLLAEGRAAEVLG